MIGSSFSMASLRPLCVFCGSAATCSETYTTRRTRVSTTYHRCAVCGGVFLAESCRVSATQEKARYDEHNNALDDPRNRTYFEDFLGSIVDALNVLGVTPEQRASWNVLDYGSGPSPSLVQLMREQRIFASAVGWDLYYSQSVPPAYADMVLSSLECSADGTPKRLYDLVTAQEVVEHFVDPLSNWRRIASIVKSGGFVAIGTYLLPEDDGHVFGSFNEMPTIVHAGAEPPSDELTDRNPEKRPRPSSLSPTTKRARVASSSISTDEVVHEEAQEEPVEKQEMKDGACMPRLFANWAYRRDPTHVSFYTLGALKYVADQVGLDYVCSPGLHKFLFRRR